jgi:hypothetical protein
MVGKLSVGTRTEVSRLIGCSPEALYAMITDLSRMGEWSPENIGGRWKNGSGPTVGGKFSGKNRKGILRWTTTAEVTNAEPNRHFEFLIHLGPLRNLVTWGYILEPDDTATLVREYRQDHRPKWLIWLASKQIARLADPDAHYTAAMASTLERLAESAETQRTNP